MSSLVVASAICFAAVLLFGAELTGMVRIAHPLFWLPIAVGTFGIAGSNYIYCKTYLKRS